MPQFPLLSQNQTSDATSITPLLHNAALIEEWQLANGVQSLYQETNGAFWLISSALGAIRFNSLFSEIESYPYPDVDPIQFEQAVIREWLPLVYQMWGYQVLHASAAIHLNSRQVIAFSGLAGAGKSTLGYGLGQRPGWQQIADESLAMTVSDEHIRLSPIPNIIRLRASSAKHYGVLSGVGQLLDWAEGETCLKLVFFLDGTAPQGATYQNPVQIIPLDGTEAYTLFLQQAFALTLKLHKHNQRLMQDYLHIARQVAVYRLVYSKSLALLDEILDVVEDLVPPMDQIGS